MTDGAEVNPDPRHAISRPRRGRWLGFAVFCSILIVAAACIVSYQVVSRSRYTVIGDVDAKTGYRIEYTVSTRFARQASQPSADTIDYVPRPPPRVVQWISKHVFRKKGFGQPALAIEQYNWTNLEGSMLKTDEQGYPEFRSEVTLIKHGHFLICGCPATWISMDASGIGLISNRLSITGFAVHPPGTSICYTFAGFTEGEQARVEANRELLAIRDSIRIVRVK